eukprot:m.162670 g.162670  ORF g.162670 m.162670 type:complete len:320 (-) comp17094_c0_seq3:306-1265(-)
MPQVRLHRLQPMLLTAFVCAMMLLAGHTYAMAVDVQAPRIKALPDPCDLHHPSIGTCSISVMDVVSTQALLGMQEVICKRAFVDTASDKDLEKFVLDHIAPAAIGPDGIYIMDHHHDFTAIATSSISSSNKVGVVNILADWSNLSKPQFYAQMLQNRYMWLYDEKGYAPLSPALIPRSLLQLINYPYRSLAWMVRNNGGYGKTPTPFSDFLWSQFFAANNLLPSTPCPGDLDAWTLCQAQPFDLDSCYGDEPDYLAAALPKALALASSGAARDLPGFGQGVIDYPNCGNSSMAVAATKMRFNGRNSNNNNDNDLRLDRR